MSSFSIDEVRASFTADMTSFLERIERTAQSALSEPVLRPDALEGDGRAVFTTLGELGHAVFGTTSLVGAESLRESARALEELALAGDEALERLERAAAMAREIAQACAEGATRMQQMLAIELDNRGPEARGLANEWVAWARWLKLHVAAEGASAAAPPAAVTPLPPEAAAVASGEDSFAFESEPAAGEPAADAPVAIAPAAAIAPPAEAGAAASDDDGAFDFDERAERDPAFGGELLEIFRREGCETLRPLGDQIAVLRAQPEDLGAVCNIERLFHTLKGASATVGLEEVSHAAARLQERMDDVLEQGIKVSPAFVDALVSDTNEMLRRAQLPLLTLPEVGHASAGGTARAFFLEEVQEIQQEAQYLVEELGAASAETVLRARAELGKLFHRLKGSALIVGEERVGVEAEKLQVLFERDETASTAHGSIARTALARIAKLLGQEELAGAALSAAVPAPVSLKLQREPVTLTAEAELWDAFKQESGELIEALERETLALEESQQPQQVLEKLMNLLHTLKGVLNTIGLAPTARELHRVEDFIEALLKAPILPPMRAVATLLLKVQADVRRNLGEAKQGFVETSMARLEARISKALLGARGRGTRAQALTDEVDGASVRAREQGASVHSIADARSVRGGMASVHAAAASSAREPAEDLVDRRFIRVGAERLDSLMNLAGELVVSRSRMLNRVSTLRQLQQELGRGSKRLVETVDEFREGYEFASLDGRGKRSLRERKVVALTATPAVTPGWEGFGELELDRYEDIHILSRRLAEIVGDVSELSVQLSHGLTSFADDSQSFDAIVSGIKNEVTRARMVPLDLLFTRLRLPVRDAASRETKDVRVTTEGAELNLDKTIADALFAPMLHLVRNAVVHGIEGASTRQAAGKSPVGVITLRARQDSGQIVVEVKDDGSGLDLEALRTRGARMGLVSADTPLSDPAIKDLVFAAGLSTRQQAGAVSGRGVGCDVVRRAVERMNGTIAVESEPGQGTTFIITLPVTLAITKALLVRQGKRTYAIPLYFAERLVDTQDGAVVVESAGQRRIKVDDVYLTVSRFDQHLGGGAPEPGKGGPVLLLRVGDQRAALQVDAVLGQEEVVVKSLGDVLVGHPMFAGVTIRGSGELVLIVDVPGLMETKARRAEQGATRPGERKPREDVAPAPAALAARPARLKVLFVDDSLSVRKYAELTFKGLGVDVTLAVDGVDALARLRHESFDLVFTDLEMPRMHGFELIRELRFVPAYRDLPIVVVTSRSGQKHQQQARALGATEYLTKPFSAEVLAAVLARWGGREARGGKSKPDPRERSS